MKKRDSKAYEFVFYVLILVLKLVFFSVEQFMRFFLLDNLGGVRFYISVSWWSSTGVWLTASLLRSPELFSVFQPISTTL